MLALDRSALISTLLCTISRDSHSSIRTSLKAAQGDLYFLDKALLFLGKPVTFIEFHDISSVVFSR